MTRKPHLFDKHLENVAAEMFEKYSALITRLVERQNGIYALYDGDDLYYVGLASNLRSRLKAHLKDRHSGLWSRFSVYFTTDPEHLKELESLVLRIAKPRGNRVNGKLAGSVDQKRLLEHMIKEDQDKVRHGLLGKPLRTRVAKTTSSRTRKQETTGARHLRSNYKGGKIHAILRSDGSVSYNGAVYSSLSAAGQAITKRNTNGRHFWRLKNDEGEWERICDL